MKINIVSIFFILVAAVLPNACSDFLNETPNKSGSADIYHMDQLLGLTGSLSLYLANGTTVNASTGPPSYLREMIFLGDALEYDPVYWYYAMNGTDLSSYQMYCLDREPFELESAMDNTWTPCWTRIYTFNTVIENLDVVVQTTVDIRNQIEGEARFGRAYFHFLLLTQYCLWREDAPGIGYRDNTVPGDIPARETVGYTLRRIYEDLTLAEEALRKAGRTQFEFQRNFRPTVPTVQAFRARLDLYRGNYESALQNATNALAAYNTLLDFKNDPLYQLFPSTVRYFLDETDSRIESTLTSLVMTNLSNLRAAMIPGYVELYLPSMTVNEQDPISESFYNLFDRENDARWIHFYHAYMPLAYCSTLFQTVVLDGVSTPRCIKWADQKYIKLANYYSFRHLMCNGGADILGMTTAEMYLIRAECLARNGNTLEAANVLRMLRRVRFMTNEVADGIGGTLQEVLEERTREMGAFWRAFDIKRLNGADNAGITIRRPILSNYTDPNSVTELVLTPEDGRWAIPFNPMEIERMGWAQNEGWK